MDVDVRRAVLAQLARGGGGRFGRSYLVAAIRQQVQCTDPAVWEALWGLVGDGLVYLDTAGQGSSTDNWQWRLSYAASSMAGAPVMAKELARPRSNYFALWTEFRKRIEPIRQDLPNRAADALTLDAIADLIRLTRNEVGHPTGRRVDEDTARVHLTIAPMYLRKMQQLASIFAGVPASGHS